MKETWVLDRVPRWVPQLGPYVEPCSEFKSHPEVGEGVQLKSHLIIQTLGLAMTAENTKFDVNYYLFNHWPCKKENLTNELWPVIKH